MVEASRSRVIRRISNALSFAGGQRREHLQNISRVGDLFRPDPRFRTLLTWKPPELLMFIHERIKETGVLRRSTKKRTRWTWPRERLHRLITRRHLEERFFPSPGPVPDASADQTTRACHSPHPPAPPFQPQVVQPLPRPPRRSRRAQRHPPPAVLGHIAAAPLIEAIQDARERMHVPGSLLGRRRTRRCSRCRATQIEAGISTATFVVIRRGDGADNGEIVVALVMGGEKPP